MFFVITLLEYLSEEKVMGWNPIMYRLYYVLMPPMVALMGTGTLCLLAPLLGSRPYWKYFLAYTISVSIPLFAAGMIAPIKMELFSRGSEIVGDAMPSNVRVFSPFLTIPGGLALILGAIYSFGLDKSRKYNLLIALGGLLLFYTGLRARFGDPAFFCAVETAGTLLLFAGFLSSWQYIKAHEIKNA